MPVNLIILSFLALITISCDDQKYSKEGDKYGPAPDGSPTGEESTGDDEQGGKAGELTAGNFDDNLNFSVYREFVKAFTEGQQDWEKYIPSKALSLSADRGEKKRLQIAFAIDATGSMDDELSYLQAEAKDIALSIVKQFDDVAVELGLVVYRDRGDNFVSEKTEFVGSANSFIKALNKYTADGGGDYPEAMEKALSDVTDLQWDSSADTAKVLFLIADAPPHDEDIQDAFKAIEGLAKQDVVIYPIGASGVGDMAEFVMRTAAVKTAGEYLFLTDDSGIGNTHDKPHIPCYHVLKLKDQIRHALAKEVSGKRVEPKKAEIVRTVGSPKDGVCREQ
jgi:hypothetical protein